MNPISVRLYCFFMLLLLSCQNTETSKNNAPTKAKIPEVVAREWQNHIDKNEFAAAKKLSTEKGIEWIEIMEVIFLEDNSDSNIYETEFLKMDCFEIQDKAYCAYEISEEGFEIQDTFFLVNIDNQWLVDIPD